MAQYKNVTLNTVDKGTTVTLSNGDLTASGVTSTKSVKATHGKTSGKWYWEVKINTVAEIAVGIVSLEASMNASHVATASGRYYRRNGFKHPEATAYGEAYIANDIIGVALDLDNGTLEFYKNGVSQDVSHNNIKDMQGDIFPAVSATTTTVASSTVNFGGTAFAYPVPTGYLAYARFPVNKALVQLGDDICSIDAYDRYYTTFMTSATSSGLVATTSNETSLTYAPWRAFDGALATYWQTATGILKASITLDFTKPKRISKYKIQCRVIATSPNSWVLQGSQDGIVWEVVDSVSGVDFWEASETKEYKLSSIVNFRYYRLEVLSTNGTTNISIQEISFGLEVNDFKVVQSATEQNFIDYGMDKPVAIDFSNVFTQKKVINADGSTTIVGAEPFSLADKYDGKQIKVLEYSDNPNQTESIVDIEIEDSYTIYDELGDNTEVLYYTENARTILKNEAKLELTANYSPLDEIEGDFEIVKWTDEEPDTADRTLRLNGTPIPQLTKLVNPKEIYGQLDGVIAYDVSQTNNEASNVRFFIGGANTSNWYVWDKVLRKFVLSDASTEKSILSNGMKYTDLKDITDSQWRTWGEEYLNFGIFLKDDIFDTIVSAVDGLAYKDTLPRETSAIQGANLSILNTTAKIDIAFDGNILRGVLSDDDLTRVQYRVLVNNSHYFPSDGSFTKLGESPQNIEVAVSSKDVKIDDWNTIKIEFQDLYGTTDYWQTSFIGTQSGLMFKDVFGQFYSNEIGEVLQLLDFGIIIAGQTTIEHEIVLKNQYGYEIKNIHLFANESNFPTGMTCEFSASLSPFSPHPELRLNNVLKNNEEMSFFIRLKTELGTTPDANGSFDIIVRADQA